MAESVGICEVISYLLSLFRHQTLYLYFWRFETWPFLHQYIFNVFDILFVQFLLCNLSAEVQVKKVTSKPRPCRNPHPLKLWMVAGRGLCLLLSVCFFKIILLLSSFVDTLIN